MTSRIIRAGFWLAATTAISLAAPVSAVALPPKDCDRCFAMVQSDATIVRSRNLLASRQVGNGRYELEFKYPINNCAINATPDGLFINHGYAHAFALVGRRSNNVVWIETVDLTLVNVNTPFSLVVTC